MLRYIVRRVLFLIPVLLGVAFCVFTLLYLTPGDPARMVLGDLATEEAVQEFRNRKRLNDPELLESYFGNTAGGENREMNPIAGAIRVP